jgi:hypothetical protein
MTEENIQTALVTDFQLAQTVQDLKAWTVSVLETVHNNTIEINNKQDSLFEQFERQLAALTSAYVEMASMLESIVSSIVNRSDEDRDIFFDNLRESRKTMIDVLKHASQQADRNADRFVPYNPDSSQEPSGDTVSE